MTEQQNTTPAENDQRAFVFAATGGESVVITATYALTWRDELVPSVGVDEVCDILEAWIAADPERRAYLWPSTEASDDDVFLAYIWDGRVVLDSWKVVTPRERYSLADLPTHLPGRHYTLTEAPEQPHRGSVGGDR